MRTWVWELLVVATVLIAVWLITGGGWTEALGAIAVILTFCHTQVAFRLEEQQKNNLLEPDGSINVRTVECFRWQSRYFLGKEICWLLYFTLLGAWSALAGDFMFLIYPWWREYHNSSSPSQKTD